MCRSNCKPWLINSGASGSRATSSQNFLVPANKILFQILFTIFHECTTGHFSLIKQHQFDKF